MSNNPPQNPSKKHHYIPAFYLSQWHSPSTGKLVEFRKPRPDKFITKEVTADYAGYKECLYSLEEHPPEVAQDVEHKLFVPVDQGGSVGLNLLQSYGHIAPWTDKTRTGWTRFILSLLVRSPSNIKELRRAYREKVFADPSADYQEEYARERTEDLPENFSDFLKSLPVQLKEQAQFGALRSLIDNEKSGVPINRMLWRVLMSPPGAPSFLTSDRPVLFSQTRYPDGHNIALPISPSMLFIATNCREFLWDVLESDQHALITKVNELIVDGAEEYVYAQGYAHQDFVARRIGLNPKPSVMSIIAQKL